MLNGLYRQGDIELERVPLGTMMARLQADDFACTATAVVGYLRDEEQLLGHHTAAWRGPLCRAQHKTHARRQFFELHAANQSQIAKQALDYIGEIYAIERDAKALKPEDRWRLCQQRVKPILDKLHDWMLAQRLWVPDGSGTAKALDYSLKRWVALTRYLEDGQIPIHNNHVETRIRPVALSRNYGKLVIMQTFA